MHPQSHIMLRIVAVALFAGFVAVAVWASKVESAAEHNERLLRLAATISTESLR